MPKLERLTSWDRHFLASLHMTMDAPSQEQLANSLIDSMGKARQDDELLHLSSRNAMLLAENMDLRADLQRMTFERDAFRRRFLWALTTALGLGLGVVITVASCWWLMAGMG